MELTKEHYVIAEKNGISRQLAYRRYNFLFWSLEDAITKPHANNEEYKHWKRVAVENGLSEEGFRRRVRKGMTWEEAATKPKRKGGKAIGERTYFPEKKKA